MTTKFKPNDIVTFSIDVVRRSQAFKTALGTVVKVKGNIVSVDFKGTFIKHEDGGTIRHIPSKNLRLKHKGEYQMKPSRLTKLNVTNRFASLPLPRYISTDIGKGLTIQQRKTRYQFTGGYRHGSNLCVNPTSQFFYLASDFCNFERYELTYSYHIEFDTVYALVVRLPHNRFLAGNSLGAGMASEVFYKVYDDEVEACYAAKEHARVYAEALAEQY